MKPISTLLICLFLFGCVTVRTIELGKGWCQPENLKEKDTFSIIPLGNVTGTSTTKHLYGATSGEVRDVRSGTKVKANMLRYIHTSLEEVMTDKGYQQVVDDPELEIMYSFNYNFNGGKRLSHVSFRIIISEKTGNISQKLRERNLVYEKNGNFEINDRMNLSTTREIIKILLEEVPEKDISQPVAGGDAAR